MSHYTNPAFCQKSEFYPHSTFGTNKKSNRLNRNEHLRSQNLWSTQFQRQESNIYSKEHQQQMNQRVISSNSGPFAMYFNTNTRTGSRDVLPKKQNMSTKLNTSCYALVPVDELPSSTKDRYTILPSTEAQLLYSSSMRLTKSQDDLDVDTVKSVQENEDSFTSLPLFMAQEENQKLMPAFSSDFINKSLVLMDQNNVQRYTIVPTDDDEEVVDSNHEIIQMCNGRAHRYAIIPADDEENCIHSEFTYHSSKLSKNQSSNEKTLQLEAIKHEKPPKSKALLKNVQKYDGCAMDQYVSQLDQYTSKTTSSTLNEELKPYRLNTPTKNPVATQKLHDLLSTPRKCKMEALQRFGSYQTIIQRSPNQIQSNQLNISQRRSDFVAQKLDYEAGNKSAHNIENRTTAIITPRLQMELNESTLSNDKHWTQDNFQKVENATATIGIVSLMLILTGVLNSGLCLYMISDMRRSYYLEIGIISGFAAMALGTMGFRSRQCQWLPNRNFISGYVLVTVFSLLNCCGLLVLLVLNPYPGTPIHDLTTGVILALSTLIILIISLGVITTKWCMSPPPDNRVDVF